MSRFIIRVGGYGDSCFLFSVLRPALIEEGRRELGMSLGALGIGCNSAMQSRLNLGERLMGFHGFGTKNPFESFSRLGPTLSHTLIFFAAGTQMKLRKDFGHEFVTDFEPILRGGLDFSYDPSVAYIQ